MTIPGSYLETLVFKKAMLCAEKWVAYKRYLHIDDDVPIEEWIRIGDFLQMAQDSLNFWIGDWLAFGDRQYGEMYPQGIQEATGKTYEQLANCKYVATRVEADRRKDNLSWSHHAVVAKLEPDKQKEYLDMADKEGMSVEHLRHRIAKRELFSKPPCPHDVIICKKCKEVIEPIYALDAHSQKDVDAGELHRSYRDVRPLKHSIEP